MVAARTTETGEHDDLIDRFVSAAVPRRTRSILEFAEEEVWLPPPGPYKNLRFRGDRQPFLCLLFEELENPRWEVIAASGPTQSSKTLGAFCIPILHTSIELRENLVIGIPEGDMVADKFRVDIFPVMKASPYLEQFIPKTGRGSKGGEVKDAIVLGTSDIKIITRGGQDTGKAGYTAKRGKVTEAAGWSGASETSSESDNFRQFLARLRGFARAETQATIEGTVTTADELPWRLRGSEDNEDIVSTMSRLLGPCPHCHTFVSPGRANFFGWQDARTIDEASENAHYLCPACNHRITEDDRVKMNRGLVLVHHGQHVDEKGDVVGPAPPTRTLWFHWSQFHNLMKPSCDHAAEEWEAKRTEDGTEDRINAEKALSQFCWSEPYKLPELNISRVDPNTFRKQQVGHPRGVLPAETDFIVLGVDCGKWLLHYTVVDFLETLDLHIPEYDRIEVPSDVMPEEEALLCALRQLRDRCEQGWLKQMSDQAEFPIQVWIDSGYLSDTVYKFVNESDTDENVYRPCKGQGVGQFKKGTYHQPKSTGAVVQHIGNAFHISWLPPNDTHAGVHLVEFDADYWKQWLMHRAMTAKKPSGDYARAGDHVEKSDYAKGRMTLFDVMHSNDHLSFAKHLAAEHVEDIFTPGKGVERKVIAHSRTNHWLDSTTLGCTAGSFCGFSLSGEVDSSDEVDDEAGSDGGLQTPDGKPYFILNR